jgi:hypothetical protein
MNEPIWKLVKNPRTGEENIVWRQWDDGKQESCSIYDQAYLKWVALGNTPQPADEVTK